MSQQLVGTTDIDLEDRYYSMCYAVCGISDIYQENGYNAWRDQLLPSEILKKMCKKWHLKPPVFYENRLIVFTIDNTAKTYTVETAMEEIDKTKNEILRDYELENKKRNLTKENLALKALKDWKNISLVKLHKFF